MAFYSFSFTTNSKAWLQKHILCSRPKTINSHPVEHFTYAKLSILQAIQDVMKHPGCNTNACGFFIIKICAGVNPQSHISRHFITCRSSFVCRFNLWMHEKINNQPCFLFFVSRWFTSMNLNQDEIYAKISPTKTTKNISRDEIMKNLNWTEHEKRFVENFYGCLNWTDEHLHEYFTLPPPHRMNLLESWNNKLAGVSMS